MLNDCRFCAARSTAVEVALKMAFRTFLAGLPNEATPPTLHVLGLCGAYHGDTLGAMDAVEPSVFNSRQFPWYDFPLAFSKLIVGVVDIHSSKCVVFFRTFFSELHSSGKMKRMSMTVEALLCRFWQEGMVCCSSVCGMHGCTR